MSRSAWDIIKGEGPLLAVALHNGHDVQDEVLMRHAVEEADRLREEDPFTGRFAELFGTRITVNRSRFELDLNRPRKRAIYLAPKDAWGLTVWKEKPPAALIEKILSDYDRFYETIYEILSNLEQEHGHFVVFDIHSYNHRRSGPDAPPDDPAGNPEINIGKSGINMEKWGQLFNRFLRDLRSFNFSGRKLDVRVNVRFEGSHFSRWVHKNFPDTGCSLAIEFKKFFMNEWTGELYMDTFEELGNALKSTLPGIIEELSNIR
ncbi:MAG: N-formylglutamate amidohydrolase [Planctomycetota bacterium]|jgi:hypothetical protein